MSLLDRILVESSWRSQGSEMLDKLAADPRDRELKADLSDIGVNLIREAARKKGMSTSDVKALLTMERDRIQKMLKGGPADGAAFEAYLKTSRQGASIPMHRSLRIGVFFQLAGRGVI